MPDDGEEDSLRSEAEDASDEKDPRIIARKYQLELCKKALEENVIVYLGTGCGKTHIAVLLMYELQHLVKAPQKRVCIFLAPTVALVHQQAKVIESSVDFTVGIHCGSSRHLKSHSDWEKEIEEHEVLVMTPQILLHNLSHSFIKMDFIAVLIFDECHHAQIKSSHPYAEIMKVFYKGPDGKLPRIFGMTASPVVGKGASSRENLAKSINSLENLLQAKVYSVGDEEELESFVATPVIKVYPYAPAASGISDFRSKFSDKLEEIKRKCLLEIRKKTETQDSLQTVRSTRKLLVKFHDSIMFCLDHLGLWGASQACQILLRDDHSEWNEIMEVETSGSDEPVCQRYLAQAAKVLESYCRGDGGSANLSQVEVLKEPFFSSKILRLIGILSSFRLQPNMKCIVFVNRIVTARSLSFILQNIKLLAFWKCDYLVGVHSGVKSMSRKSMNKILDNFRSRKLNLLVATKVGEEGLDIQTCCLVIRYDLPETVASFIQSRGRARMAKSEYAFLVNSGDQKDLDLIENFQKSEARMNVEISCRTSDDAFVSPEERVYKISASGATITSAYSISLLHHYCSKLPHDEYFDPKPNFYYRDDLGGTVCNIILPCNAPIHEVLSAPQSSMEAAKRDACLNAIEQLHKLGALNNFLLPEPEVAEDDGSCFTHSRCSEEEETQGETYEMLIPLVLKQPGNVDGAVRLYCYFLDFSPIPIDRNYFPFGLFVKAPLPLEAERLEIDLHLDRGRSVITKLVPSGMTVFDRDEIMSAQNFQEMYLKVILDRSEFATEYVKLGPDASPVSSSTFYLLLPVILDGRANEVKVEWNVIRKCLSSPVFGRSQNVMNKEVLSESMLQLANGSRSVCDIKNSLVYVPYQNKFYFISGIVSEKDAFSPFKSSCSESHMEHLDATFDIHLKYPKQHLLRAKQLFSLRNLLHERGHGTLEANEKEEHSIDLVPELCELKITAFSKEIGSSISLLPSIMHRLENFLVAIELKRVLSEAFPEGSRVTAQRVLEALTTENCQEGFSLERLEILGDGFLKFVVARNLFLSHATLDEGELTRRRSNSVNNENLFQVAINHNLQVYVRDQPFDPCQFFAVGRPCLAICTDETQKSIHLPLMSPAEGQAIATEVRCSKGHHFLRKKTIADVVEALVGAFLVDSGFEAATAFLRWIGIEVDFDATQVINLCRESLKYMDHFEDSVDIVGLENSLGCKFHCKGLLVQAFVHPSYNKHEGGCYQRLEFLGDAVLDYAITCYLFSAYPKLKPGQLTDLRSALVNNRAFANVAINQCFQKFIVCDSPNLCEAIEKYVNFVRETPVSKGGLHVEPKCPKALGDLVESCMGAFLLDSGMDLNKVWKLMLSFLNPMMAFSNIQLNPTRELQEICQSRNWDLQFPAKKKGRIFLVEGKLSGKDVSLAVSTINSSKREATRIASELILARLKEQGYASKSNYLEEILKSSCKMEAKLIGFDESPVDVISALDIDFGNLTIQESFTDNSGAINDSVSRVIRASPSEITANTGRLPSLPNSVEELSREIVVEPEANLLAKGVCHRGSARSCLFEICAANHWKPPVFECCHEEGLSHLKSFTFKVILQIEDAEDLFMECFGAARTSKKAAAEHAAEGALWYLKNEGYLIPN